MVVRCGSDYIPFSTRCANKKRDGCENVDCFQNGARRLAYEDGSALRLALGRFHVLPLLTFFGSNLDKSRQNTSFREWLPGYPFNRYAFVKGGVDETFSR